MTYLSPAVEGVFDSFTITESVLLDDITVSAVPPSTAVACLSGQQGPRFLPTLINMQTAAIDAMAIRINTSDRLAPHFRHLIARVFICSGFMAVNRTL
ncbi:MAG: hypothetical protein ACI9QL_003101 [Candidatus Omnitrophota bacterium]|jgi:hypothetical protein